MAETSAAQRRRHHFSRGWLAVILMSLVLAAAAAAQSGEPTTYQDCYRSLRGCQNKRCGNAAGQEQVTCVRQCAREYDTCASGASAGREAVPEKHRKAANEKSTRQSPQRYRTPAAGK